MPLPDIKRTGDDMQKYQPLRNALKSQNGAGPIPKGGILGLCRSPVENNSASTSARRLLASRQQMRQPRCRADAEFDRGYKEAFSNRPSEDEVVINYEDYRTESRLDALIRSDINVFMDDVYGSGYSGKRTPPSRQTTSTVSKTTTALKPSQKLDMMLEAACMQDGVDSGYTGGTNSVGDGSRSTQSRRQKRRRDAAAGNDVSEGSRGQSGHSRRSATHPP